MALRKQNKNGEERIDSDAGHGGSNDMVVCFVSDRKLKRSEASELILGPGKTVWIDKLFVRGS